MGLGVAWADAKESEKQQGTIPTGVGTSYIVPLHQKNANLEVHLADIAGRRREAFPGGLSPVD
jgi:hypothetical protein